jgi:NTE family protein
MNFRNERRSTSPKRPGPTAPRIGIALSCGGAKSLAHVGVIQVLEENGVRVHAIAGSSMGAYIGALWAAGFDGAALADLAAEINSRRKLWKLADITLLRRRGFVRGDRLRKLLEASLGDRSFSDLDIDLSIVATRLHSLERAVLREGRLVDAVRASCAMPGIFVPVRLDDGHDYIDGGIVSPLPVRELRGVDKVIAVSTLPDARSANESQGGIFGVTLDALSAAQMRLASQASQRADVFLQPVSHDGHWRDYTNFAHYIELGRQAALDKLDEIKALTRTPERPRSRGHFPIALSS